MNTIEDNIININSFEKSNNYL